MNLALKKEKKYSSFLFVISVNGAGLKSSATCMSTICTVADLEGVQGVQGVRFKPPPRPLFLNIL